MIVGLFFFHSDMLIIFEKIIINECNFRFINIEAARIIILMMKSSTKIYERRELSGWKDVKVWKDFRQLHVSDAIWMEYIQHVMFKCFK
jgi:hypothetical protein